MPANTMHTKSNPNLNDGIMGWNVFMTLMLQDYTTASCDEISCIFSLSLNFFNINQLQDLPLWQLNRKWYRIAGFIRYSRFSINVVSNVSLSSMM